MPRAKRALLFVLAVLFAGCSRIERMVPFDLSWDASESGRAVREGAKRSMRYPWEVWPLETDLNGKPLHREEILKGDAYLKQGNRRKALSSYLNVKPGSVEGSEREALVLRIASTELALNDADHALTAVSDYFRANKLGVDDADPRFSLILGYGYLKSGNVDQSLAWFSRIANVDGGRSALAESAKSGVRTALSTVPEAEFDHTDHTWTNDSLVSSYIARERRRRLGGGGVVAINRVDDLAIIEEEPAAVGEPAPQPAGVPGAGAVVGVLLPLTGEYANLGQSTRNGIDLALAQEADSVSVVYKDSGPTAEQAYRSAGELVASDGAAVVLGPLLSEHAAAVSDAARQEGFPLVTFSKKDSFQTGEGVFRLGATASSQVKSLLDACHDKLGMRRFALVYPNDPNGREFALNFKNELRSRGGELVYESGYSKSDQNALVAISAEVESHRPDGIFLPDSLVNAARFFSLMAPESLRRTRPIGPASWDNQTELTQSQNVMEGAIFVSPFYTLSAKPTIARFVEAYRAKFGQPPNFLAAQGFDAATMVAAALKQGAEEGVPFSEALHSIEVYDGLTGTIRVERDGEIDRTYSVVQFKRGAIKELSDGTPTGASARLGVDPAGGQTAPH